MKTRSLENLNLVRVSKHKLTIVILYILLQLKDVCTNLKKKELIF